MKKAILTACLSIGMLMGCSAQSTETQNTPNKAGETASKPVFPEKELTLVVPFAAGGGADMTSRIVAKEMEEKLKQPVMVVNKTGGTGGVGMSYVQASPNDGYTLGFVSAELTLHKPLGLSDLELNQFDLLSQANMIPNCLAVPASAPYNTIEEFIEHAKKNPGQIKVGYSGAGSITHIAATVFANKAGLTFTDIPFDGSAPAITALMGGHLDAVAASTGAVKSGVDAKKLKVLAVMSADRVKNLPEVPTLKEKGIDVDVVGWGGFVVPKGTPEETKAVLAEAIKEAVNSEEFQKFVDEQGQIVAYKSPEEFTQFGEGQSAFFSELVPTMKFK